jgi:flagellar motility protein MotE (MotC chaperone)
MGKNKHNNKTMSDIKKSEKRIKYLEKKLASYKELFEESKEIINKQRLDVIRERAWRMSFRKLMQEAVKDDDFQHL